MAFNEVKECCKGHQNLTEELGTTELQTIGKRHHLRLMSDAYGKGIVRGQVENTNLRAYHKKNAVTHAECIKTCQIEAFFGREYIQTIELLNDKKTQDSGKQMFHIDRRNRWKKRITLKDVSVLYGQRPNVPELWFLSPYEFVSEWEPILASYPTTLRAMDFQEHHCDLTEEGIAKLKSAQANVDVDLLPSEDYRVRNGGDGWYAYPETPSTQHFRAAGCSCAPRVSRIQKALQSPTHFSNS